MCSVYKRRWQQVWAGQVSEPGHGTVTCGLFYGSTGGNVACAAEIQVMFKVYESDEMKPYLDAANAEKEAAST